MNLPKRLVTGATRRCEAAAAGNFASSGGAAGEQLQHNLGTSTGAEEAAKLQPEILRALGRGRLAHLAQFYSAAMKALRGKERIGSAPSGIFAINAEEKWESFLQWGMLADENFPFSLL